MLTPRQQDSVLVAMRSIVGSEKPEYVVGFSESPVGEPLSAEWSLLFIPDGTSAEMWLRDRLAEREARRAAREAQQMADDSDGYGHAV